MQNPLANVFKTELKVAGTLEAQPLWFRIMKHTTLFGGTFLLRKTKWFWFWISGFIFSGLVLHLTYRYKTKNWTKSWRWWNKEFLE